MTSHRPICLTLPAFDQFSHGANRLLDRNLGVDPMEKVEIDCVDAEPLQALITVTADDVRPCVNPGQEIRIEGDADLGHDRDVSPSPGYRATDE